MKVYKITTKETSTNIYLYYNENTKDAIAIDLAEENEQVYNFIEENKLNVKGIFLTHGHYDHIAGVEVFKEKYNCNIYSHKAEVAVINNKTYNLSDIRLEAPVEFMPDILLEDKEIIDLDSFKLQCIHTPGHTVGCACFYDEENEIIFTGDTLFKNTYGRIDLYTSSEDIFFSIKSKLFKLPDEVVAYPGHMGDTTIGREKKKNPINGM